MRDIQSVDLAGGTVEYRWYGPAAVDAELPVYVLLHEGLGCVALWRDFPERLAERLGRRVLAYSRYGYGGSSPCALPRPVTYMHDEARDVLPELLAALGIGAHVLVGHSDGGSIALIYAGSGPRAELRGLVTIAAHIFGEPINAAAINQARSAFDTGKLREALARYHGTNTDCAFRGWSEAWLSPGFADWNLETFLPGIDVPILIVQGSDDEYGTLAQVEGIAAGVSGPHETLVLPACGHAPHRDQPDAMLSAISRFSRMVE
ncbi:alpha/beta fold hydrolase [Minwuia sp.]|uniref:alpha/beta fold hydrolase n=1 Tax=Minwuia sp. TaxID=2493630 RepID=UPI003A915E3C